MFMKMGALLSRNIFIDLLDKVLNWVKEMHASEVQIFSKRAYILETERKQA